MDRSCSRPMCNESAVAQLVFVYNTQEAWLQELPIERDLNLLELCQLHAGRFRAPQGWQTSDRRVHAQPLAVVRRLAG
ncbi:MAG: DUF3499 family protein [Acidimicrobiales bacterium]